MIVRTMILGSLLGIDTAYFSGLDDVWPLRTFKISPFCGHSLLACILDQLRLLHILTASTAVTDSADCHYR